MQKELHNEIDIRVGSRIRQARIERGLSQQDIAAHLGITFQQVQKYEIAANRISAGKLWAISQITKKRIGYFFDSSTDNIYGSEDSKIMLKVGRAWLSMKSPKMRKIALELMEVGNETCQ